MGAGATSSLNRIANGSATPCCELPRCCLQNRIQNYCESRAQRASEHTQNARPGSNSPIAILLPRKLRQPRQLPGAIMPRQPTGRGPGHRHFPLSSSFGSARRLCLLGSRVTPSFLPCAGGGGGGTAAGQGCGCGSRSRSAVALPVPPRPRTLSLVAACSPPPRRTSALRSGEGGSKAPSLSLASGEAHPPAPSGGGESGRPERARLVVSLSNNSPAGAAG